MDINTLHRGDVIDIPGVGRRKVFEVSDRRLWLVKQATDNGGLVDTVLQNFDGPFDGVTKVEEVLQGA